MIFCTDREYKETKLIKKGVKFIPEPFHELADWITDNREVKVINIVYDCIMPPNRPRLQIILEYERDHQLFKNDRGNYLKSEQDAIRKKFIEIVQRDKLGTFSYENLLVIFSAFEPVAIDEAHSKVSDYEIEKLRKKLKNNDLWKIRPSLGCVTFFFFTEDQVKYYEIMGVKKSFTKEYIEIIKVHDEFGYLNENNLSVKIDSKENFDKAYNSNWFYYDR